MAKYNYSQVSSGEAGGNVKGWSGGSYGYWDANRIGSYGSAKFVPFSQQPIRTQLQASNPAQQNRQQLINQTQTAIDESKQANLDRYNQALGNLEGVGTQGRADINQRFDSSRSAVNQNLIDSGLASTTVLPTMRQGVERNRTSALNRLESGLAREKNQIIQSRTDTGPSLESLYRMMLGQGSGGF